MRASLAMILLAGCAVDAPDEPAVIDHHATPSGRDQFDHAFAGTNGRSCASCHILADHGILRPDRVAALPPSDPLFNPIDADDPTAGTPAYRHLARGLVRVTLPLPATMDVLDADGNVVTNAARTVEVWRGVPTIENVAATAPYQLDGRATNLRDQAQAAISSHSQGPIVTPQALDAIARFERTTFSSPRAEFVALLTAAGVDPEVIPIPEKHMPLSASARRGRNLFERACAACHGAATTNTIADRTVHDSLFFQLRPDGTVIYDVANGVPTPRLAPHPHDEFLNIGFGLLSGYGQLGILPMANADVELPHYRFRFYRDATRTTPVVDLPPIPRDADGNRIDPSNPATQVDANGAPIVGPSLAPQWFSTDPGRALITGDPADFDAFDIPQLRGVAHTAPYFHDNSHATLHDVVDSYSRFVLPFLPSLGFPLQYQEPNSPFFDSLSLAQKADLIAFLEVL